MFTNIAIFSAFNLFFGLYSHFIKERLFLSESLVSMLFGIAFTSILKGNSGIVQRGDWKMFMVLGRFVMTFQTMAAGISLPRYKSAF